MSFVHKVMNKARMEGGSKDRAYFARHFRHIYVRRDLLCVGISNEKIFFDLTLSAIQLILK
ncbi:hypothetical protein C0674_11000 [Sporolactobacillus terrae]|uniref:Uncharacterized protein n=1 Tax=Sporolactobacillus terrae TaxID=269673 RepID=A0ABX5Q930_9BACL|nr:hypothetical protein C0674_11000 [Sporolactobacillus terrae]QAA26085.1 hypothetical protein C0679_10980 [Sporolactobacillus terrae]